MITGLVGLLAGCGVGLLVGAGIALRRPPVRVERAGADALSALDALHDGHLLTDASGRILWASQGALALLDLDVMPVDRDLVELFPGYASAGTAAVRRASTGRALGHYHRLGFVGRNGLTRWLEASFQPLGDDLLWSFREPDREPTAMLERLEELERSSDEKRRFLTSMSHEMRTPLNAILGYTEMVREDLVESGNDAYEGDFRRILRAGRHLLEVVNAILDLAKIEAGRLDLHPERTDLGALVLESVEIARPLATQRGSTLEVRGSTHVLATVDVVRVRQILLNLLGNACKFTEDGKITVSIQPDGDVCRVVVEDTGVGIPPEEQAGVFREFTQAQTNKVGGTGLGLAISLQLARLMGGGIDLESVPGVGSTFVLVLPLGTGMEQPNMEIA